jgi:IclR family pca regulon transcriptional regulator
LHDDQLFCAIIAHMMESHLRLKRAAAPIAKADLIEGVVRGMAVLESFDLQRQRLNATLAAERAGITRAAARRHLLTLTHLGYLESDGRYFWLSAKVLRLSGSFLATSRLPRAVQPMLDRLALQTGEAYSVAVLDGQEVVIVGRSGPAVGRVGRAGPMASVQAYGLHLGARLPAHATSTGRMLLACLPPARFRRWLADCRAGGGLARLTPMTLTDPARLSLAVAQARQDDHCCVSQEHELGVEAVAVPLRDRQGHVVAALNLVSTPSAMPVLDQVLPVLLGAASQLRPAL